MQLPAAAREREKSFHQRWTASEQWNNIETAPGGFSQWSGISAFAQNEVWPLQLLQICCSNEHIPLGDMMQIKDRLEDFRKCSQLAKH